MRERRRGIFPYSLDTTMLENDTILTRKIYAIIITRKKNTKKGKCDVIVIEMEVNASQGTPTAPVVIEHIERDELKE